jgi:hypothetical protein
MHETLLVLRVSTDVLDLPGTVITDGNASGDYVAFLPSPQGLEALDYDLVFARYWTHQDIHTYWHRKSCKCSEVLAPNVIPPDLILGCHASCADSASRIGAVAASLAVQVNPDLFFQ